MKIEFNVSLDTQEDAQFAEELIELIGLIKERVEMLNDNEED